MSTEDENVNEGEPHHTPEQIAKRFAWSIGVLDKKLDRFDAIRRIQYQKATWSLAAATGLVGLLGLVKGKSISATMKMRLTNQIVTIDNIDKLVILGSLLFAVIYIALLHNVIIVYSPKRVVYPFSLRSKESGPPVSKYEDREKNQKFIDACWEYTMETYIKPDDFQNNREVLWEYIKVYTEHHSLNLELEKPLRCAFNLLYCLVLVSFALIYLG